MLREIEKKTFLRKPAKAAAKNRPQLANTNNEGIWTYFAVHIPKQKKRQIMAKGLFLKNRPY